MPFAARINQEAPGFKGVVLGTGMMYAHSKKDLRSARVLALRGKGSLVILQVDNCLLGDFGLAMRCIMPKRHPKRDVGEIPHHVIHEANENHSGFVIDLTQEPWPDAVDAGPVAPLGPEGPLGPLGPDTVDAGPLGPLGPKGPHGSYSRKSAALKSSVLKTPIRGPNSLRVAVSGNSSRSA